MRSCVRERKEKVGMFVAGGDGRVLRPGSMTLCHLQVRTVGRADLTRLMWTNEGWVHITSPRYNESGRCVGARG